MNPRRSRRVRRRAPWNHNIHLHGIVTAAVPRGARSALDVGTGDGLLARELRDAVPDVTAVDIDAEVLARAAVGRPDIVWVPGDIMQLDVERPFDVVASVATIHHLPDMAAGLSRLRDLTAPGGVLVIIGLARASSPGDHLRGVIGALQHRWYARRRTLWEHSAPTVWPPPHTYNEVRRCATEILPGVLWRQHPMWRYSLVWRNAPSQDAASDFISGHTPPGSVASS
ncbi:methyltransferase family protein [Microbacterium sp. AG1240]|nr:methyltransferase family protein [Microbacterium sp. AG1240]